MARISNFLGDIRSHMDDEDYEVLERLSDPDCFDTKIEMGESFDSMFGYDPISYHDRQYLEATFDDIVNNAPDTMQPQLKSSKDTLIEGALSHKPNVDEEYLYQLLVAQIYAETGWLCSESATNLSNAIFDEVAGVDYPVGDDDAEDDSDDDASDDPLPEDDEDEPWVE